MDTKILVAVPTAEMARQAEFYDHYNMLERPVGSISTFAHGQSPARNRNLMIKQALEFDCTHILFLDDDLVFKPDLLNRLLAHDVDIVTALYLMRNFPHQPIIFDVADEKGRCQHHFPTKDSKGLVEIVACGLGACLIKTHIFRVLEEPWIRLGELELDHWCDDLGFFRRVRAAGFKLHCDLDCFVEHFASLKVGPARDNDGNWLVSYNTNGTGTVTFPMPQPVYLERKI